VQDYKNMVLMKKILIVEDEIITAKLIERVLIKADYQVIGIVDSGQKAIEDSLKLLPDLILMDIHLTDEIDGITAAAKIHEKSSVPIIFLTSLFDKDFIDKAKETNPYGYILKPFNDKGLIVTIEMALNKFQTEEKLKESEEHFRELFENANDIVYTIDFQGNFTSVNPIIKEILGYSSKELIGSNIKHLLTSESYNMLMTSTKEKTINNIEHSTYEIEAISKKGQIVSLEINSFLRNKNNQPIEEFVIARDVTYRKELERKILNVIIETEEKERKRFAEDLHDGLGPLLSSIKIYFNLLQSKSMTEAERVNMLKYTYELIDESVSSTRSIANNLLPNVLNDYGLIKAVKSFCEKINATQTVEVDFKTDNLEDRFEGPIEIGLYRIIMELINNTLKHASAKKIQMVLKKNKQELIFEFKDDGIGFDVENQACGMGVNSILSRVKSMNGICQFNSKIGKGIDVHINLKLGEYT
jgi:PAS domain S-box-containing protein